MAAKPFKGSLRAFGAAQLYHTWSGAHMQGMPSKMCTGVTKALSLKRDMTKTIHQLPSCLMVADLSPRPLPNPVFDKPALSHKNCGKK